MSFLPGCVIDHCDKSNDSIQNPNVAIDEFADTFAPPTSDQYGRNSENSHRILREQNFYQDL